MIHDVDLRELTDEQLYEQRAAAMRVCSPWKPYCELDSVELDAKHHMAHISYEMDRRYCERRGLAPPLPYVPLPRENA